MLKVAKRFKMTNVGRISFSFSDINFLKPLLNSRDKRLDERFFSRLIMQHQLRGTNFRAQIRKFAPLERLVLRHQIFAENSRPSLGDETLSARRLLVTRGYYKAFPRVDEANGTCEVFVNHRRVWSRNAQSSIIIAITFRPP